LTIASAGWITIGSNYLGLATLPGTWMAISVGIFAIPVFLLWPLLACTLQIMRARDDRVAPLQAALDRALVEFEVQAQTERRELPQLSEGLQKFATARESRACSRQTPFRSSRG
jgi:hypothetical protein